MPRKPPSKKLRFEVFKRDSFTCQYCGRKAPDVVLHVDHVNPVSKGGSNDILNLITSCLECNLGKGAREISDESVLAKQQEQLAELNEKREQLAMMIKWRDGLKEIDDEKIAAVIRMKDSKIPGWTTNEKGRSIIAAWVRDFPFDIILDAIEVAKDKVVIGKDGKATEESVDAFGAYIPRVATCKLRDRKDPGVGDLYRLRGYMRTFMDFRDWECIALLKEAHAAGFSTDELKSVANTCGYWSRFGSTVYDMIRERSNAQG